jgi:hypothetical protein
MHTGKEPEKRQIQKGRLSCDSDAPQVGSARSDSTRVAKVNRRKTNRRKTRPYCILLLIFKIIKMSNYSSYNKIILSWKS